jgi:hypothetical protein
VYDVVNCECIAGRSEEKGHMSIVEVGCLVGKKINIEAELLHCDPFYVVSPDSVGDD